MDTRIKYYFLPVAFLALFVVHGVDQIMGVIPEAPVKENRPKVPKPEVRISHLDVFPTQFDQYYNDVFNWRDIMVRWGSRWKVFAMQESPMPDKVLIGKSGWYFKSGLAREIYRGTIRFGQKEINEVLRQLKERKRIVEAAGARYYIAVPPIKHHVYPEYLPDALARNKPQSSTTPLLEALASDRELDYIDLFAPIMAGKKEYDSLLYHKTDHHWTDIGAFIGSQTILRALQNDFPSIDTLNQATWETHFEETEGWILTEILGIEDMVKERVPLMHKTTPHYWRDTITSYQRPKSYPKPYVLARVTDDNSKPRIFLVRDSFASPMAQFLSEEFSYSFYLWDNWQHGFNEEIFKAERCDIYIQLVWEGLLIRFLGEQYDDWHF